MEPMVYASQRVVGSYRKSLAEYSFVSTPGGVDEQAQRDLHAFLGGVYIAMNDQPAMFGLPLDPDAALEAGEPNEKDKKQAVKKLLDKARKPIDAGVNFLRAAGVQGALEQDRLRVSNYAGLVKESGVNKKFLAGLAACGLQIDPAGADAVFSSPRYPRMMAALRALSRACAGYADERTGGFMFARCDFRALLAYQPQAEDFFHVFTAEEYARAAQLHAYFIGRNYRTEISLGGVFAWNVKYQGDRKMKATPLFQIDYEERYARPQRMQIKCASTGRIAGLVSRQSARLQADFQRRAINCNGSKCDWCRNKKTLGPTVLEYNGEQRTVCWYSISDIREFDEHTIELIEEYEQMHAGLAPEKG
jgi:hypothetical protein